MVTGPVSPRIAIVGMGCRFPGAQGLEAFWQRLNEGRDPFTTLPTDRWDPEVYASELPHGLVHRFDRGAVIEDFTVDWRTLRLPPLQVERMHRMEKLALVTMSEALSDAGITVSDGPRERAMVVIAASTLGPDPATDHGRRIRRFELAAPVSEALECLVPERKNEIDEIIEGLFNLAAPPIDPDSMMTSASLIAGRIANLYDFRGGHLAVDAGMASSLAAIEQAVTWLSTGTADVVLVCGISPLITPSAILAFAHRGYLSRTGPRPFHPEGDGTLLGEGCAAIVLRRLEDVRDERVYACIDGIAGAVVPRQPGDRAVERATAEATTAALVRSGRSSEEVSFVESRACGLAENDGAELRGLTHALGTAVRHGPRRLSSSVPVIGFLQAASGMAAVVKTALALSKRTWPAQATASVYEHLQDGWEIPKKSVRWEGVRCAGVSDAGLGPVAYHAVLSGVDRANKVSGTRPLRTFRDDGVAIVGCGLLVPQANDVRTFWHNVVNCVDAIGDLPTSRWDLDKLVGASKELGALLRTRLAGVVEIPPFDPARFRIPPAALRELDPSVVLVLLATEQALVDAGYEPGRWDPERIRVIVGQLPLRAREVEAEKRVLFAGHLRLTADAMREAGLGEDQVRAVIAEARARFDRETPPFSADALQSFTSSTCAARVAAAYDFRGGILAVDAACASSLAAVHLGVESLLLGEADVVVASGVAYNLLPEYYLALGMLGFLSPRGAPAFHAEADGFVPAEGAATVVLRRLSDAIEHREPIYAVIRGIGCSSDGKGTGVFVPNTLGQQRAMVRALERANIDATTVDLLEAHGAGTRVGDRTEMTSYAVIYGRRDPGVPLTIGTVKSQIGHLSSAAGMVGLIKTALAVREKTLPPSHFDATPDPEIPLDRVPFELAHQARPWVLYREGTRRAAVSAFGLGGVNYHLVLEEHDRSLSGDRRAPVVALAHPARAPATGTRADRFVVELVPVTLPDRRPLFALRERHILLVPDSGEVWRTLEKGLRARGARVTVLAENVTESHGKDIAAVLTALQSREGAIDGVFDLSAFGTEPELLNRSPEEFADTLRTYSLRVFEVLRTVYNRFADAGPHECCYVAVTSMGGDLGLTGCDRGNVFGALLLGAVKGLKQELPSLVAKAIDFSPGEDPETVTEHVLREVEDGNERMEVGFAGRRLVVNLRRENFTESTPVVRSFGSGDVFVFSGGGRGVAFECACALARMDVRVVVCGRTEPPDVSLPWLSLDDDQFAAWRNEELARRRAKDPTLTPARFAQQFEPLVRQRELHRNLQRVRELGLPITYEVCDITNSGQVRALIDRVRSKYGRIDGIAHGAMVEWSRSLSRKTPEMIEKTVATKVVGLFNLLDATRNDPLRCVVSFGSGAGRFGNRGQVDYSAANALMAALLPAFVRRRGGELHHVTIDWTAWESVGAAVANADIAALVRATGVTSISPVEGTYWFLNELGLGRSSEVVIFEERMLHTWPCLGSRAEGEGERAVQFDDRGEPLVPGQWPFVDYVIERAEGRVRFERRLDIERDEFLAQHKLYGVPIVPATFGCEILAEAAALTSPGWRLESAEDIRIDVPVKLHRGSPLLIRASARVVEDRDDRRVVVAETRSHLFLRGRALQDRLHHSGRFVLRRGETTPTVPKVDIPEREGVVHARSFFHMAKDPVALGPMYCNAQWIQVFEQDVVGTVRAPRQRDVIRTTSYPVFQTDPLLMDAAFQIAANWDGHRNGFVSIPFAIGGLTVGRRRGRSENARVWARVARIQDPDVFYDITVVGDDGGKIMEIYGVHLRRIARLDKSEPS